MKAEDRQGTRTQRLFAMILLLQTRPSMTSRDLAEHFDVSRRTIFRDLRALADSGVPLTYSEGGGYEILEGYQLPPLMLSAREAATLLIGTEFMRLQSDASLQHDGDAVARKIEAVLPREIREFVDQLRSRTVLDPYWAHAVDGEEDAETDVDSGRWYKLSEAVARQRKVIMEYWVERRQELTQRRVDPYGLVYYTDHWNLIAFDHLRGEVRNFRLDQMRELFVLTERFEIMEGFDLAAFLKESGVRDEAHEVRLRFEKPALARARRTLPAHPEEEVEGDDAVDIRFRFDNLDYLSDWLMRFGASVQVLAPDELAKRHKALGASIAAKY